MVNRSEIISELYVVWADPASPWSRWVPLGFPKGGEGPNGPGTRSLAH